MLKQEQIVAGLKKIGPCSPGQLADHLEVETPALSYHLNKMLDAGVVKAAGTSTARRVALPEQQFDSAAADTAAPPQRRKTKKHRTAKHAKKPRKSKPRAARPAAPKPAERFIPTVDADSRLIIVNGAEPSIFSEEQTEKIAALLFQHYDKA